MLETIYLFENINFKKKGEKYTPEKFWSSVYSGLKKKKNIDAALVGTGQEVWDDVGN